MVPSVTMNIQRILRSLETFSFKGHVPKRCVSSALEARESRSELFTKEQERQKKLIPRLEKIEVLYKGVPEDCTMIMNKGLSTPYNCCQHMNEMLMERSVVAEVNGELWDMHRPLPGDCELRLLHFHDDTPYLVNKTFWRSCSFMLGSIIESAFKDSCHTQLHSFPAPNVRSGSFVYDAHLAIKNWKPTQMELRMLSSQMIRLSVNNLPFERLDVDADVAQEMFRLNQYKLAAIPQIASNSASGNTITVYRLGDFVDISRGPMISNSNLLGRCSIAMVHRIESTSGSLFRFQGVALPRSIHLNHFAFGLLEERARTFNTARIPGAEVQKTATSAVQ